jgi:hypothetical protein
MLTESKKGIWKKLGIPYPDGIKVKTQVETQQLSGFVEMLGNTSRVYHIGIFPIGIPGPAEYGVEVEYK